MSEGFSVMIPSWRDFEYLKLMYQSIKDFSNYDHELLFFFNEANEEHREWAKQHPDVKCLFSEDNTGVAHSFNRLAELSTRDYLYLGNSDFYHLPGWDTPILDLINENMILCSMVIEPEGSAPLILDCGRTVEAFDKQKLLDNFESLKSIDIVKGYGHPFIVPKSRWTGMDEKMYPGWCTDDDLVISIYDNDNSVKFLCVKESVVYHFMSVSTSQIKHKDELGKQAWKYFCTKWKDKYPGITPFTISNIIPKQHRV